MRFFNGNVASTCKLRIFFCWLLTELSLSKLLEKVLINFMRDERRGTRVTCLRISLSSLVEHSCLFFSLHNRSNVTCCCCCYTSAFWLSNMSGWMPESTKLCAIIPSFKKTCLHVIMLLKKFQETISSQRMLLAPINNHRLTVLGMSKA